MMLRELLDESGNLRVQFAGRRAYSHEDERVIGYVLTCLRCQTAFASGVGRYVFEDELHHVCADGQSWGTVQIRWMLPEEEGRA